MRSFDDIARGVAADAVQRAGGRARPSAGELVPAGSSAGVAPPSPLLAAALRAVAAPLMVEERPNPRGLISGGPDRVFRTAPMPEGARDALPEARARLAALREKLRPAPRDAVETWLTILASLTRCRQEGTDLDDAIELMAGMSDRPACCFTHEAMAAVIRERGEWFPAWAEIDATLERFADPHRDERRHLEALIALLEAPPPANRLAHAAGGEEVFTEAEMEAWTAGLEAEPASFPRTARVRRRDAYLRQTQPELHARFADRMRRLLDEPYGELGSAPVTGVRAEALATMEPGTLEHEVAQEALRQVRERRGGGAIGPDALAAMRAAAGIGRPA